ncbi:MAG: sugar phosphate nucleotidyltransferase [Thermodesulfobacteriota bacterium]
MKALVLSAGFGTRLKPYTLEVPKPLFPVGGRPILDIIITRLIRAGVTGVAVNTHYMADRIESFLRQQRYGIDIVVRYEPDLLGTGGAVGNFSDFFTNGPFIVINSDVLTDIDMRSVHDAHMARKCMASLVMHDYSLFNKVSVSPDGLIRGFSGKGGNGHTLLAFTGISVIDPAIYRYIEPGEACCIIDIYRRMIRAGEKIAAHRVSGHYWNDLGTPERFRDAVAAYMAPAVFEKACKKPPASGFRKKQLAGDGSDRKWYRITAGGLTLIMADHGIHAGPSAGQADAFVAIGRHLHEKKVPVPEIYDFDRFSGLVFLQDLGDTLLQEIVSSHTDREDAIAHYQRIIDILIEISVSGKTGFDPAWAYEGPRYDRRMVIEKECRYFTDCFLKGYLGLSDPSASSLAGPFADLADAIMANAYTGLMHRDFQSRNIMIKDGRHYIIDFQGARLGPIQYDLASLLADPYVDLSRSVRESLLAYAAEAMENRIGRKMMDHSRFVKGYRYCCISRLMQALGAYGFLSRVKKKPWFEQYIPTALAGLLFELEALPDTCGDLRLSGLAEAVSVAMTRLQSNIAADEPGESEIHRETC